MSALGHHPTSGTPHSTSLSIENTLDPMSSRTGRAACDQTRSLCYATNSSLGLANRGPSENTQRGVYLESCGCYDLGDGLHGTLILMGAIDHSVATLRFFGDDLVPDEITLSLGAKPTASCRKGQELLGRRTGTVRIAKTGSWRLSADPRQPGDLDAQIMEILGRLTQDLSIWESLSRFQPDLFCGQFMGSSNDGLPLKLNLRRAQAAPA